METKMRLRGPWAITLLALVAAVLPLMSAPARADVIDLPAPAGRCIDTVAAGFALNDGIKVPAAGVEITAPGPIVNVVVEWIGRDDAGAGVSALDLEVTGPSGSWNDPTRSGTLAAAENTRRDGRGENLYAWWSDITDLFGSGAAGTYTVDVEPFATPGLGISWGGVVTVVYDTTPCEQLEDVIWKMGADYYFGGRAISNATTDVVVYDWDGALAEDVTVTVRASHGGADGATRQCRVSTMWAATGAGPAPAATDSLADGSGNAAYPGATAIVSNPFSPPSQSCPPSVASAPAVAVRGGSIGAEFALVEVDIVIPAGSEWMAFQLESPSDNAGFRGLPESGAWAGGGVMVVPTQAEPAPAVTLEKTVLAGADAKCPGIEGTNETVVADLGESVTYCLHVTNTGTTPLFPVHVADLTLGLDAADMTLSSGDDTSPLLIGGTLTYAYSTVVTGDLHNEARVSATPADAAGTSLGLGEITAGDTADVLVLEPGLELNKTVLPGSGGDCPGIPGSDELVAGAAGTPVTYCFELINTGDVDLASVDVTDAAFHITTADMTLVSGDASDGVTPGESVVWAYETTIGDDLVNTATATATTADDRIAEVTITTADTASVSLLTGDVRLDKTVIAGDESCPAVAGDDKVQIGLAGAPVTYCYVVTNTGELPIAQISLTDPELGIVDSGGTMTPEALTEGLQPGASLVLSHGTTIQSSLASEATVTGTLTNERGEPLGLDPVFDTDAAEVLLVVPAISLEKTVAAGHETDCSAGEGSAELTVDEAGAPVTFCFTIVNEGDTALYPVSLLDTTYGVTQADMERLAGDDTSPLLPGEALVYAWRTTVDTDVINIAVATGTPVNDSGATLAPLSTVAAEGAVRVSIYQEQLPLTGSASQQHAGLGLLLMSAGVLMVLLSRGSLFTRRRQPS